MPNRSEDKPRSDERIPYRVWHVCMYADATYIHTCICTLIVLHSIRVLSGFLPTVLAIAYQSWPFFEMKRADLDNKPLLPKFKSHLL